MTKILVGVSTYNEMENLPTLVERIDQHLPEADILIVDDNSPDGTGDWSEEQAEARDDFFCERRAGKLGLGTATIATFTYADEQGYDWLINMDADLSHPAEQLPQLVKTARAKDVDVVIGSRYVSGGKTVGWPLARRLMSRCVNLFARLVLGLPVRDCSGAYRCYRVAKLRELDLSAIRSQGYSFFEEILWLLRRARASFLEIPITFQDRQQGQSKINLTEAFRALWIIGTLPFSGGR